MKNKRGIILLAIFMVIVLAGCNKKLVPAGKEETKLPVYDSSAFDYVYTEAIKQKLMGNAGEALKYLEQAVRINNMSDAAYYQMAQVFMQTGDVRNCKKYALRAYTINDKNIWYMMLLAGLYYQEKNIDSTIVYYERIITVYPDNEEVRFNLGNIYYEKGKYEDAGVIFRYFAEKYGLNENIALPYIKNLINSGELKKAEEKIILLLGEHPEEILYNGMLAEVYTAQGEKEKAINVYKKLMETDSSNPQTLLSLCDFLVENRIYEEMFTVLNTIILNEQVKKEDKVALCARLLEDETIIREKSRETEMIIRVLEATYKDDQIVKMILPELYLKLERKEAATSRLEQIIGEDPNNYFAWEKLLIIYSEYREYDRLLKAGRECATKFNMSYLAKILYASAATEKGLYEIALEELRKAKILAGSQSELLVQVATMEADLYYRNKEYEKAFDLFREALKIKPDNLIVLNNFAYYLAEQNRDLKEAERMAAYVVDAEKLNYTYLDTYAWILYKRGKIREAGKIMEKIITGGSEDLDYLIHYGYILKASGKCSDAVRYWEKALGMDPVNEAIKNEIKKCIK